MSLRGYANKMHPRRDFSLKVFSATDGCLGCDITLYGEVSTTDGEIAAASVSVPPPQTLCRKSKFSQGSPCVILSKAMAESTGASEIQFDFLQNNL